MLVLDFFCCYVNFPEASVSIREVLFYRKGPQGLVLHVTPDRIHQVISSSMQRPWRSQVYFMCDFAEEQILTLQYNKMCHHKRKLGNNQNSSQNPTFYILSWSFYSIGVTLYSSLVDFIKIKFLTFFFHVFVVLLFFLWCVVPSILLRHAWQGLLCSPHLPTHRPNRFKWQHVWEWLITCLFHCEDGARLCHRWLWCVRWDQAHNIS